MVTSGNIGGGIIPACAGSTARFSTVNGLTGDHPRMCGEHVSRMSPGCGLPGSSPHVRGAHVRRLRVPLVSGIIPACAGSTNSSMVFPVDKRDHPRMCGEHGRVVTVNGNVKGASPHVRGAPAAVVVCHLVRGIIPACAGSTCRRRTGLRSRGIIPACAGSTIRWSTPPPVARDHPRMCGEHYFCAWSKLGQEGSSPHVRGARIESPTGHIRSGIIPACAGSTSVPVVGQWLGGDHPRMCGEHLRLSLCAPIGQGSSPHVRGALGEVATPRRAVGIIPACAGSTARHRRNHPPTWDHPRMCGEHFHEVAARAGHLGSSPHVRGARRNR